MTRFAIALAAATALTLAAGAASAASSPFDGTWKLDVAKSKLAGDTMTYAKTATGYTSIGSNLSYPFALDGKDYPTLAGRTTSWAKASDGGWDITYKMDGKVLTKAHRTLSADGKSMMTTYVESRPDGTTATEKDVYMRLSGTSGIAGKWKSVKVDAVTDIETISTPEAGSFKMEDAIFKEVITGKLDGSPIMVSGPTIPKGAGGSYVAKGPAVREYTMTLDGKVLGKGVMKLNADGKSMTDTSWVPGKEDEKSVSYFVKQ